METPKVNGKITVRISMLLFAAGLIFTAGQAYRKADSTATTVEKQQEQIVAMKIEQAELRTAIREMRETLNEIRQDVKDLVKSKTR
jgi:peptidoglycan hydrolase CwlO-like protein